MAKTIIRPDNAGGNTSSSTKHMKNLGGSSQLSAPRKHQVTTEWIEQNMVDTSYGPNDYHVGDVNFGIRLDGTVPENQENTQGHGSKTSVNPGPGITRSRYCAGSKDSTPGGGW
jgi:hypothetical protein